MYGRESRPKKRNGRAIIGYLVFHPWHQNSVFSEIWRSVSQKVHSWAGHWIHRRYWQKGNGGTLKFRILWGVLKSVRTWPWGVLPATCQSCPSCSLALQASAVVGDRVTWHPGRDFLCPYWNLQEVSQLNPFFHKLFASHDNDGRLSDVTPIRKRV